MELQRTDKYSGLFERISSIIESSRARAAAAVNEVMIHAYWNIGREIVEQEQKGKERAEYGKAIIDNLSAELTEKYGKGFIPRNLWFMQQFFLTYPILNAVRSELTWTHYRRLLKLEDRNKRSFYEIECAKNRWSTRELDRQINSLLFDRLALSRDKEGVMALANEGILNHQKQID